MAPNKKTKALSGNELDKMIAYWNAANYLSVGQIYLLDNPLLKEPLKLEHIKPRLLGHWGTTPGLNFIYVHFNRLIKKFNLDMIYITGPGHGGPGLVANTYLEGTYSEVYPDISQDEEGMKKLFKQFSFPGGIPSHVAPETPGSIHEGGELGYAVLHAYGAVFDNPDLIACCVVGDGEAETGALAASWHSNKFLNPVRDGAVLPILHLNGYKIANPTIFARIPQSELEMLFSGYGYKPYFVEGSDPVETHTLMAEISEKAIREIKAIQKKARTEGYQGRPRWPMIILKTPKGWTCPESIDGKKTEGNIEEASSSRAERIYPCRSLSDAVKLLNNLTENRFPKIPGIPSFPEAGVPVQQRYHTGESGSLSDIKGHEYLKKALCVAAAGMHNLLLFGPPGSGKTLAGSRLVSLLPDLDLEDSIEVTRIYSLAGLLKQGTGLVKRPPFRSPHHTSSMEGLIGGGRIIKPGEISLAHKGVLFLDETPEFRKSILQCLREPSERGRVDLARAGKNCWFPADFQLILAANPCPCGNRGKDDSVCLCSDIDIYRYWKKVGGALLDRIDIRVPVMPVDADIISGSKADESIDYRSLVLNSTGIQNERYKGKPFKRNSRIPAGEFANFIQLQERSRDILSKAVKKFSFSSRAVHSVMKIARTCADIKGNTSIVIDHDSLLEAIQLRRYGDRDFFW